MGGLLALALRNLARRPLRTGLTLAMVLLGTALIVFSVGLTEGTYDDMVRLATATWAGHFQVTREGYEEKPSLFKTVDDPQAAVRALEAAGTVRAVTRRVEAAGLLAAGSRTAGILLHGVEPSAERTVSTLPRAVTRGGWLDAVPPGTVRPIVLGKGLAQRLRVTLGGEVGFVGQAADGSIASELFTVTGIVESGSDEMDGSAAWVRLDEAQELLVLGGRVHRIVGLVDTFSEARSLGDGLRLPHGLAFLTWEEVLPSLHTTIEQDRAGNWISLGILLAVVVLGVANTMTMVVMERTREFGLLMALGTSPARVLALVLCEASWVSGIGAGGGLLLGAAANLVAGRWGIPVGSEPMSYGGVTLDVMHAANTGMALALGPLLTLACGVLAALPPGLRAARLSPADAIREG
jgi:ABC-type lipoprotein release transport system permease subunit